MTLSLLSPNQLNGMKERERERGSELHPQAIHPEAALTNRPMLGTQRTV